MGASRDGEVIGVAIVGRPVARLLACDPFTAEVTRLCTDGTRNACSMLYSATWRASRALGYHRLVTYTLQEEGGASLRAAGWRVVGETAGGGVESSGTAARRRSPDAIEIAMGGAGMIADTFASLGR